MKINSSAAINIIASLQDDEVVECQHQGREIILVPVKKANLSWGRKIQAFFGFGPYKFQTITSIFQNFLDTPKVAKKVLSDPTVLTKLNLRIDHYNNRGLRKYCSFLQLAKLHEYKPPKSEGVREFEKLIPSFKAYLDSSTPPETRQKVLNDLLHCLRHLPGDYHLYDAIVSCEIPYGLNILHLACDGKHKALVEKICKTQGLAESLMQITTNTKWTPLEYACRGAHPDPEVLKCLLTISDKPLLEKLLRVSETPLDIAIDRPTINPHFILTFFQCLDQAGIQTLLQASKSSFIHKLIQKGSPDPACSAIFDHINTLDDTTLTQKFMLAQDTNKNTPLAYACLTPGKEWAIPAILKQAKPTLVNALHDAGVYIDDIQHPLQNHLPDP
ncbi:MAG: hypothetical protein LLF94_02365 [Chlamydiales bacterium]|nr:hypothetical protein [Chlamydiales bacterium]